MTIEVQTGKWPPDIYQNDKLIARNRWAEMLGLNPQAIFQLAKATETGLSEEGLREMTIPSKSGKTVQYLIEGSDFPLVLAGFIRRRMMYPPTEEERIFINSITISEATMLENGQQAATMIIQSKPFPNRTITFTTASALDRDKIEVLQQRLKKWQSAEEKLGLRPKGASFSE